MSSQLTNLVPVFDGQNYGQWAKAIKVFLMSQELWCYETTHGLLLYGYDSR